MRNKRESGIRNAKTTVVIPDSKFRILNSSQYCAMKIRDLIKKEERRQQETIDLIPSENLVSPGVRKALGSVFTNKYAEGYPGRRYYPGNAIADDLERTVQDLAFRLFRLSKESWRVNVQPYSGSPANAAVYFGLLEFRDPILGLSLTHGGHLTHGHRVTFSGRGYEAVHYGVDARGFLDYAQIARLARRHRVKLIISGATAYPRKIDFLRIGAIARKVGAYHLADISHVAGLVAAGLHPSPFGVKGKRPAADIVMTTTHKTLRGPRAAILFSHEAVSDRIDRAVFPGLQGGPHLNTIAAIGVALEEALKPSFRLYQRRIIRNAAVLASALRQYGFSLLSGGTENHLMLIDARPLGLDGGTAERTLERAGILANRNTVPDDPAPFRPSGLRLGTPSVTSRGMDAAEMRTIARWVRELLVDGRSPSLVRREVRRLCRRFPTKRSV